MGQFGGKTLGIFTRRRKRNIDWEVPHTRDSEFAFHDVGLVYLTDEIVLNHKQPIKLVPAMILALTQETEQARDRSTSTFKTRDQLTDRSLLRTYGPPWTVHSLGSFCRSLF